MYVVEVLWNSDENNNWIEDGEYPTSLYGPFKSMVDAMTWMDNKIDDADVREMLARELRTLDDQDYINYPSEFDIDDD